MSKIINDKKIENVSGGSVLIKPAKYSFGQKVRFFNPYDTNEVLVGTILQGDNFFNTEGYPVYQIEAESVALSTSTTNYINIYLVSENYIIEVIG